MNHYNRMRLGFCAVAMGLAITVSPASMARGGGGHGGGHVSFSHSSGRSGGLFGSSTRSGSGFGKIFSNSSPSSSPVSPKSNSVLGGMLASRTSGKNLDAVINKPKMANTGTDFRSSTSMSTPSLNTTRQYATSPSAPSYVPPAPAYASTAPQTQHVVVDHYHNDSGNGFVTGMVMGSLLSHHDSDNRPVVINNTPAQSVPQQHNYENNSVSNPMQENHPSVNSQNSVPSTQVASTPAYDSTSSNQSAPDTTQVASVDQTKSHSSHIGIIIFFLLLAGIGGAGGLYMYRKNNVKRSFGEHVVDQVVNKFDKNDEPTQQDMSPFENPLNVKVPVAGTSGKGSVVTMDLDVRVQSMDASGHFPKITDTSFAVSGYSKLVCDGLFKGASIERLYIGEDASMFLQLVMNNGKIIESVLYTNVDNEQLSEENWKMLLEQNGKLGLQTFPVPKADGSGNVDYTRMIDPETPWVDAVSAEEDIMTPDGTDLNMHKFMLFEREHGDVSEFLFADVRYANDDNGDVQDGAFIMAVGIPVNTQSIHVY